jgi:2-keto-4-pentenoate hydratase
MRPADQAQAYSIQFEILGYKKSKIGGWKVGAQTPDAPARGSLIPSENIYLSGVMLDQKKYLQSGIELEIYFQLAKRFEASNAPYPEDAILSKIEWIGAAIEIVSSRYAEWPNVDRNLQLADLQNNGALILGERVPYTKVYPFLSPNLQLSFEGKQIAPEMPTNPAGDPRRLIPWVVNQCVLNGHPFTSDMVITTGTYTGMHFPKEIGTAQGIFDGLPPVSLHLN